MARKKAQLKPEPTVRVKLRNRYGSDIRFSGSEFEGSPEDVIAKMNAIRADFPDKKLEFSWEDEPYDTDESLFLYEVRPENEAEKATRLEGERRIREQQEKAERQQYERLQAKYGKQGE